MPFVIQYIGLFFCLVFYGMGFAFDQRYNLTITKGGKKGRAFWEYIAHSLGEVGSLSAYAFFCLMNPQWGFLPWAGVIAWCVGTLFMGYMQSKDREDRNALWIGDGKGNNVELVFRWLTWVLNLFGKGFFTMANVSGVVRLLLILLSTYKLIA